MMRSNRVHSSTKGDALTHNVMVEKLNQISKRKAVEESLNKFRGWDIDDNNLINLEEFILMAKKIPMLRDRDIATLEETFKKIDVDASGELNISEFQSFYTELKMMKKKTKELAPYPSMELNELQGTAYVRKYIWLSFDSYNTNLGKVCGPLIFSLILISVMSWCLATMRTLENWAGWFYIDAVISIVFTFEFAVRFITTWKRRDFLLAPLNVIDLCSFLPFYIELVLRATSLTTSTRFDYLRVLRLSRLVKVLRLVRSMKNYSVIFTETLILARHSLLMLANVTLLFTIVISAIMYTLEVEDKTFISVFEAMYWCVVTQTTLGYGDIRVVTPLGRTLACFTAYMGIINLTFIINVMGSCFDEAYTRFLAKEERDFKKRLELEMTGGRAEKTGTDSPDKMASITEIKKSLFKEKSLAKSKSSIVSLSKLVAELNFRLSQSSASEKVSDKLRELMAETKDLLDEHLAK